MKEVFKDIKRVYKNVKRTIKYIHNRTQNSRVFLFIDMVYCYLRYGITYNEYRIFEFYDVKRNKRKTFMSKRKYERVKKKLVDENIVNVISDKKFFIKRFKDYLKLDTKCTKDMSFKDFELYVLKNESILARSASNSFMSSYRIYDVNDYRSPAFLLEEINDKKLFIISKNVSLYKTFLEIDDYIIVNVVTVNNGKDIDLVSSSIKFNKEKKTLNGFVDINTGKIVGHFKDELGHNYPESFEGFVIPSYDKILKLSVTLAHELEEIGQIEWSFIVNSKGTVYLVDANVWNDYVFSQIREFLNNDNGLMTYYDKIL